MSKLITAKPATLEGSPQFEDADRMFAELYKDVAIIKKQLGLSDDGAFTPNVDLTKWITGPWTLDKEYPTDNICVIRQDPVSGTTYNDYAPDGIDTAVAIELEPTGNVTINGIRNDRRIRRLLGIINRDASAQITLAHEAAGSTARYRFDLPSSTNIVIGPKQAAWMYYNTGSERWQLFITPHLSGGLSSSGVSIATLELTEAQLEAMGGSGDPDNQLLVAAQGAGKIVILWDVVIQLNLATVYTNNPQWQFQYLGSGTNLLVAAATTAFNATTGKKIGRQTDTAWAITPSFDPANKGIEVAFSAALTGAGSATAKLSALYSVIDQI